MTEVRLIPEDGGAPRLGVRPADWTNVCRCGTVIHKGDPRVEIIGLPASLEVMFRGEAFCSPRCVRAFFLEVLSVLDAIDTPEAAAQVSDLREMHMHLASAFSKLIATTTGSGSTRSQ